MQLRHKNKSFLYEFICSCKYPWKYTIETRTYVVQSVKFNDITFPRQKDFLTPDIHTSSVVNHTVRVCDKPREESAEHPAACFKILLSFGRYKEYEYKQLDG